MTPHTSQQWGELRSMLNQQGVADRARWRALLDHIERFPHGDERSAATHYAASVICSTATERWPAPACSWRYSHRERTPPEPWQAPLIKGVEFDTLSTRFVPEAIAQLDVPGLQLQWLSLEWFEMTEVAFKRLMQAPALKTLRALHIKNFDPDSMHEPSVLALDGLELLAQLESLTMHHIADAGSRAAGEVLGQCHALEHLGVLGGMYERASWQHLFAHTDRVIPSLDFSGSYMGAAAINALIQTQMIDEVETLRAQGSEVGSAGLKALSKANNHVLRELDLSSTELGAAGIAALEHALFLRSLRTLRLKGNSLRPLGKSMHALRDFELCAQIHELDLGSTGLGSKTCAPLCESGMPHVHTLDLGNNALGDAGLEMLVSTPMPRLRHLDIHWNQLSDDALRKLTRADWPQLESIHLDQYQRIIAPDVLAELVAVWGDGVALHTSQA